MEVPHIMTAPTTTTHHTTDAGTYPVTTAGVTAALVALGDTPRQVADRLHAGRYFGEPGEARDCPVARYLSAVLTGHAGVSVGEHTTVIDLAPGQLYVHLPAPVRRFVIAFDDGGFRSLLPDHTDDPTEV